MGNFGIINRICIIQSLFLFLEILCFLHFASSKLHVFLYFVITALLVVFFGVFILGFFVLEMFYFPLGLVIIDT